MSDNPTPEEVRGMPAGRELDTLVAERVLGWRRGPPFGGYLDRSDFPTGFHPDARDCRRWNPSRDLTKAWHLVFEAMRGARVVPDDGVPGSAFPGPVRVTIKSAAAGWKAGWEVEHVEPFWAYAFQNYETVELAADAETPALAVCRAALLLAVVRPQAYQTISR
jgi:hypothetical protein